MAEMTSGPGWTDAQWEKVNNAVTEAFGKASVASAFLTCYGPLGGSVETVRNEKLREGAPDLKGLTTVKVDSDLDGEEDRSTQKLINLTVKVELSSEQVAEESLSNALLAFRRAASILALNEDQIVFRGFVPGRDTQIGVANNPGRREGIAEDAGRRFFSLDGLDGRLIVSAVVRAVRELEDESNPGPFACVLGNALFESVYEPSQSLVLPADRISPLLKGPLLRSGRMDAHTGVVVSLAGTAIDIVVGTPPTVQFLQRTHEARFLFRVYERFVLRIRDQVKPPIAGFNLDTAKLSDLREARQRAREAAKIASHKRSDSVQAANEAEQAKRERDRMAQEVEVVEGALRGDEYATTKARKTSKKAKGAKKKRANK